MAFDGENHYTDQVTQMRREREGFIRRIAQLEDAIKDHKASLMADRLRHVSGYDLKLWKSLDENGI